MKNIVLSAWVMLAAAAAAAEGLPQAIGSDPLTKQILSKAVQDNGGVTAAVRLGTGQAIELHLKDVSFSPVAASALAPAAASPAMKLPAAGGLVAKPSKNDGRKPPRAAVAQLRHVSSKAGKSWDQKR